MRLGQLVRRRIRTTTETTANGIVVVQTSTDSALVVALQAHAAEVTDLVQRGMQAMHEAMMRNGGGMRVPPADTTAMHHRPPGMTKRPDTRS